jgi:AhpD family alkylhydroperoxidase
MQLDEMVQYLIGIGASIGVDCKPCLQTCIALARECGADEQQIDTATAVGKMVRQCAAKMEKHADSPKEESPAAETGSALCCGCAEISS